MTKYDFLDAIQEWLNNAYAEMTKIPLARKVKEQEEILKSFQEKIQGMDDEIGGKYFTKEEGEDLQNKLEKLEEELKEFIIKKDETENKQVEEIASLHAEIETLKTQSLILNKKNWFLSLSVRIFNLFKRNPQFARQVAGFTREMLPQEAKDFVSEEALNLLFLPPSDGSSEN